MELLPALGDDSEPTAMGRLIIQLRGRLSPFPALPGTVSLHRASQKPTNASRKKMPLSSPTVTKIFKTQDLGLCPGAKLISIEWGGRARGFFVLYCFYLSSGFSRWDSQNPHPGKSHADLQSKQLPMETPPEFHRGESYAS